MNLLPKILTFLLIYALSIRDGECQVLGMTFANYIGGKGNDVAVGCGIVQNSIWVAGNFDDIYVAPFNPAPQYINYKSSKDSLKGKIVIVGAGSGIIEKIIDLGGMVFDFSIQRKYPYTAVVSGSFGIVCIDGSNGTVKWQNSTINTASKVKISDNGYIAYLSLSSLFYMEAEKGNIVASTPISFSEINDIATLNNKIFVTGFQWETNIENKSYCNDTSSRPKYFQVAYLNSYVFSGDKVLRPADTTWGFSGDEFACDLAATRGVKLCAAPDGMLYFLGETNNSENIFKYNGKTNFKVNQNSYPATTFILGDRYTDINLANQNRVITYCAKIDPSNGLVLMGEYFMGRIDTNIYDYTNNNTPFNTKDGALEVDEKGYIFIGGKIFPDIPNRNYYFPYFVEIGPFAGGDPTLLVLDPGWQRESWRVFTGPDGTGRISSIASNGDYAFALGTVEKGGFAQISNYPIQPWNPEADSTFDVYAAYFKFSQYPTDVTGEDDDKPVTGILKYMEKESLDELIKAEIIDFQGRIIENDISGWNKQDLKTIPPGNYIIRVTRQHGVSVHKFYLD